MGLDAQEAGRSVNSYEGSAGIKESGRSQDLQQSSLRSVVETALLQISPRSARAKLILRIPPGSVVEETMWQIPRRSVARMSVRRIHMRGDRALPRKGPSSGACSWLPLRGHKMKTWRTVAGRRKKSCVKDTGEQVTRRRSSVKGDDTQLRRDRKQCRRRHWENVYKEHAFSPQ